jgi:hypothetical protein
MDIWPFPLLRNYATDRVLTELFFRFAKSEFRIVFDDPYTLKLKSNLGELNIWNSNRYYAWAMEGVFTPAIAELSKITWKDRLPSRAAVRQLRKAIERSRLLELNDISNSLADGRV